MQINVVQRRIGTPNGPQNYWRGESETGTRPEFRISLRVRRLGVTDDALHGRERATQRALDLVDVFMNLDHAHRGRGAAGEVDDLAGLAIAHPHIVDVVDRAIAGKARQRRLDDLDAVGRGVGANRQFRFQRLDVGVDFDVLAERLADVAFELMGDVVRRRQRHVAVDLEVDADGELAGEVA